MPLAWSESGLPIGIHFAGRYGDEATLLRLAAGLECASEHPLALAIIDGVSDRGIEAGATKGFESTTGEGVRGFVDGHEVLLGNARMSRRYGKQSIA